MDNSIIKLRKELLNLVEDKFDLKDYEIPNDEVVSTAIRNKPVALKYVGKRLQEKFGKL